MPSPGLETIKDELGGTTFYIEGIDQAQVMARDDGAVPNLSQALHDGWTCESPITPSSFEEEFLNTFGQYDGDAAKWLKSVGQGLDREVQLWIESWVECASGVSPPDSPLESPLSPESPAWSPWPCDYHDYEPQYDTAFSYIKNNSPFWSGATEALSSRIVEVFLKYFEQEVG